MKIRPNCSDYAGCRQKIFKFARISIAVLPSYLQKIKTNFPEIIVRIDIKVNSCHGHLSVGLYLRFTVQIAASIFTDNKKFQYTALHF